MDEFVDKQLTKQKQERERYDREILGTSTTDNELVEQKTEVKSTVDDIISQQKQKSDKSDKEQSNEEEGGSSTEHKGSFKSADEALEHFGQSIAQRTVETQMKKYEEKREEDAKQIRAENAKQEAKEKKIKEEKEKKEKEEQSKRDEEQR